MALTKIWLAVSPMIRSEAESRGLLGCVSVIKTFQRPSWLSEISKRGFANSSEASPPLIFILPIWKIL